MPLSSDLPAVLSNGARLRALEQSELLDSPAEEAFDRFTRLAARIVGAPVALMSLVDGGRQFFKSQIGLPEPWCTSRQTPLSHSFCQHVVADASPLVVVDAREHPLLASNLAIRDLSVVAYLGVPLTTSRGETLGSLCVIDHQAREWKPSSVDVLKDLATFVMTEIELRLTARELRRSYIHLRDLERQRGEMVDMLVHDLRNPLTSLMGGLELLATNPETVPSAREDAELSLDGGRSLLRMINEMLDVSKAEAGALTLRLSPVSAVSVVESARQQLRNMAARAEVSLEVDVDSALPTLDADPDKLRRTLVNLIANAIQHSDANGRVLVSARDQSGRGVLFSVIDDGRGIASSDLAGLFEKFRAGSRGSNGKVSTGLGLPFCKLVVDAHGGTLDVQSEEGRGSVFSFVIPYRSATPVDQGR